MKVAVRTAREGDTLPGWPAANYNLNLDQVLVAVDEDDKVLCAVVCWDGGHDVVYVGELERPKDGRARTVVKTLLNELIKWLGDKEVKGVVFQCATKEFAGMCERMGAQPLGEGILMGYPVKPLRWNPHERWWRKVTWPQS